MAVSAGQEGVNPVGSTPLGGLILPLFRHGFQQFLIELHGAVVAEGFQLLIESGNFDEAGHISAGRDREFDGGLTEPGFFQSEETGDQDRESIDNRGLLLYSSSVLFRQWHHSKVEIPE